ncbi:MAG: 4'-phosphopantetheinyl transferase superfamily protein [Prevotella sp.]|jgi:phosphopantetheinyl transferase|nr:4'-phosphopantetheinyl transferase superfamily protein [Prevotella sp.]
MLLTQENTDNVLWAVWKIEETKNKLLSMLDNRSMHKEILLMKSEERMLERLAVRVLLKYLTGEEKRIYYHPSGRPLLKTKKLNISISHTRGYVAVALSEKQFVGIDIQYITKKIKNIRSCFVSEAEYINPDNELLHLLLHWSAKETLYKALKTPGVSLLREICVKPFEPEASGSFSAIAKPDANNPLVFDIHYFVHSDFVITVIGK